MSFLFNSKKEELSIVFDIGSGTVAGAIVKFSKDHPPMVLYTHRESVLFQKNPDAERLTNAMLKALDKVTQIIEKEGLPHLNFTMFRSHKLKHVYIVFSSPWALSQTKVMSVVKETEVEVNRALIDTLIKEEEISFQKSLKDGKYSSLFDEDVEVIERKIVEIKINGYSTRNPYQMRGHKVEAPVFMSIVERKLITDVEKIIAKYFNYRKTIKHSFTFLAYSTIRDIFIAENNFLFIDINGELTDVSVIKQGVFMQTISFPIGINYIIRKVSKELNSVPEIAESVVKMYLDKKCDPDLMQKMSEIFKTIRKEWLDLFHKSLTEFADESFIPRTVFILTHSDIGAYFHSILKKDAPKALNIEDDHFKVVMLNVNIFKDFCEFGKKAVQDSFIAVECAALNKIEHLTD
jgi:cell division ATPase FtsA